MTPFAAATENFEKIYKGKIMYSANIIHMSDCGDLYDKIWKFQGVDKVPVFPCAAVGRVTNDSKDKYIYYLIDRNTNLWIGLEKSNEIIFLYFETKFGLDLLYNFNILGCFEAIQTLNKLCKANSRKVR